MPLLQGFHLSQLLARLWCLLHWRLSWIPHFYWTLHRAGKGVLKLCHAWLILAPWFFFENTPVKIFLVRYHPHQFGLPRPLSTLPASGPQQYWPICLTNTLKGWLYVSSILYSYGRWHQSELWKFIPLHPRQHIYLNSLNAKSITARTKNSLFASSPGRCSMLILHLRHIAHPANIINMVKPLTPPVAWV